MRRHHKTRIALATRAELEGKRRLRAELVRACRAMRVVKGSLELRAMCALAYLGSAAGCDWDDIKRMLGER